MLNYKPILVEGKSNFEGFAALPEKIAQLLNNETGHHFWLDDYIDDASSKSPMTPKLFHESAGLTLGSAAIARRLVVELPFGPIYPNLFVVWIAQTTL